MSKQFAMYYGILAASIEAMPVGAVFRAKPEDFLEPIVGGPRPVPIECLFFFSEAAFTILPPGVDPFDLHFAIAAVLRHGWEEHRSGIKSLSPIHELDGHEVVTRCVKTLHALSQREAASPMAPRVVYCGTQHRDIRMTAKKILDGLCRLRREGWVAYDVHRASMPPAEVRMSVA